LRQGENIQNEDTSKSLLAPGQSGSLNGLDTMLRVLSNGIAGATSLVRVFASLLVLFVHGSSDSDGCLSGITLSALAPKELVESSHGDLVFGMIKLKLKLWEDKEEREAQQIMGGKSILL
jgi:hypothetical protein